MTAKQKNKYLWIIICIIIPVIISILVFLYLNRKNQYDAIIGIDFGSTYSGYSIIFNSEKDLDKYTENNQIISSEFIMYESKKKGLIIGREAHNSVCDNPNILLDKLYFRIFKRSLNPNNTKNFVEAASPENKSIELKYVIREFLKLIMDYIYEDNDIIKKINLEKILWIIAVPPLWDIKGKKLMLDAAKEAHMINCQIILEPEACSLSIFQDKNINKDLIKNDKTFLIVDIGGYSTDFSANRIINGNLEQLIIPKSSIHGSNQINDEIMQLIKQVIGEYKVKEVEAKHYNDYLQLLDEIEKKKKQIGVYPDKGRPEFVTINIERLNVNCEGYFKPECEGTYENYKIKYNNKEIYIPFKFFENIIGNFVKIALQQINQVVIRVGKPDSIILTGGFSLNNIFKEKTLKYYEDVNYQIIFLQNPQETVMRGSALFGLRPTKIEKRIIPINIAVSSTYEKKNSKETCLSQFNDTKSIRCLEYVEFFKRGNSIANGKVIEKKIYPEEDQQIKIYYHFKETINNNNKRELEVIDLPYSQIPISERNIIVKMKFSNFINVTVTEKSLNFTDWKLISYPTQELPM